MHCCFSRGWTPFALHVPLSSSKQLLLQGSGMDSDSDLAQLCATFSASPFVMAFAEVRATPTPLLCIMMQ